MPDIHPVATYRVLHDSGVALLQSVVAGGQPGAGGDVDRLSQAEAALAAAAAYSPAVIVPGHALSPMDCDSTIRVTRTVVAACDQDVLDAEMVRASQGRLSGASSEPANERSA